MNKIKKEPSPARMPLKNKVFIIRICMVILVICAALWTKQYNTGLSKLVKDRISYNTDFEHAAQTLKETVLKYSTFYPPKEH